MLRREGAPGFRLNNEPYARVWCRPCSSVVRIKHAKIAYRVFVWYGQSRLSGCPDGLPSTCCQSGGPPHQKTGHAPQKRTKGQRCGSQYFWVLVLFMQTRLQGHIRERAVSRFAGTHRVCPLRPPWWVTGSHSWTAMHLCTGYLLSPLCDLFPPTPTLRPQGWLDGRKDRALTL